MPVVQKHTINQVLPTRRAFRKVSMKIKKRGLVLFVSLIIPLIGCASVPRGGSIGQRREPPLVTTQLSGTVTGEYLAGKPEAAVINATTNFVASSTPPIEKRTWLEIVLGLRPPAPTLLVPETGVQVVRPPQPVVYGDYGYGYGHRGSRYSGFRTGGYGGGYRGFGGGVGSFRTAPRRTGTESGTATTTSRSVGGFRTTPRQPSGETQRAPIRSPGSFRVGPQGGSTSFRSADIITGFAAAQAYGTVRPGGSVGRLQGKLLSAKREFGGVGLMDTGGVPVDIHRTHEVSGLVRGDAVSYSGLNRGRRLRR